MTGKSSIPEISSQDLKFNFVGDEKKIFTENINFISGGKYCRMSDVPFFFFKFYFEALKFITQFRGSSIS